MINPKKYVDLEDSKKDKYCLKTKMVDEYKKDFKEYIEKKPIKLKIALKRPDWKN